MDLIDRQAAIDIFDDYNVSVENGELEAYSRDRKRLCDLPSVQPEVAKDTNVLNNDTISRQAAIDVLDEIRYALWEIDIPSPTIPEYVEHHEQVQSVWKLLDKKQKELYVLPPIQPETCDTCKHGYFGDEQCNDCRVRFTSHYERITDER